MPNKAAERRHAACIDFMDRALGSPGDLHMELRNAASRLSNRRSSFAMHTMADFVRFANAVAAARVDVRPAIMEYVREVRQVSVAQDCPPQARRMLDAMAGSMLAWHPNDTFPQIMAGVVFRKCFFTNGCPGAFYTVASFFSSDALRIMRHNALADDPFNPNRRILNFLAAPRREEEIATETLRAAYELADMSERAHSVGFESLFEADEDAKDIWRTVGARLYGQESARETMWTSVVSFITGDWDRVRGLVAILCYLLYRACIVRSGASTSADDAATGDEAATPDDTDTATSDEPDTHAKALPERPIPDIKAWAQENTHKVTVVKTMSDGATTE